MSLTTANASLMLVPAEKNHPFGSLTPLKPLTLLLA